MTYISLVSDLCNSPAQDQGVFHAKMRGKKISSKNRLLELTNPKAD